MYRPPPGNFAPAGYGPPAGRPPPPNRMPWPNQRPPPPHMAPPPAQAPPSPVMVWKEHTTPEGKKYWYNSVTRQSTWEKPDDLLTPEERVWKNSPWKEYTTPEGKKYYSNTNTKETVWEMPVELKEQLEHARNTTPDAANVIPTMPPAPPQAAVPPQMPHQQPPLQQPIRPMMNAGAPLMSHFVPQQQQQQQPIPDFATKEEAEQAFFSLLKETGVRPDWTWEEAMRAIITKPLYRALRTTAERKAAFHAWADVEAKREREEREQREIKLKADFINMLKAQGDNIKPYTRYRTLVKLCGQLPAFTAFQNDDRIRETYFDEYVQTMQRDEKDRLRELRKESMERFSRLLRSIPEIIYKTSWEEAKALYEQKQQEEGISFEGMDMLDFLSVFEEYNRQLWEEPVNDLNKRVIGRRRSDRKAREGFKSLLRELVNQRQINVRTLWKEIYPTIKDDPRYIAAVGLPDSTPLDMFWDCIDDLDEQLYQQKKLVYSALRKKRAEENFDVEVDTPFEDFLKALDDVDTRIKEEQVNETNLRIIFEHLQGKAVQRLKDEKRRQEKKLRKKMDKFRHALKHGLKSQPIQIEDTWEAVKPRVEHFDEYKDLEDDTLRQEVFEKYIKRLKEKQENKANGKDDEEDDEEEEGMIKDDEEGLIDDNAASVPPHLHRRHTPPLPHDHRKRSRSRGSRSHSRRDFPPLRRDYDDEFAEYNRLNKRRKQTTGGYSSAEEGEALDDYLNEPRRLK